MRTVSVILSIDEQLPKDLPSDLLADLRSVGVDGEVEWREGGPQASLWLLIPSLVVVVLAKPFFEAIAKKAAEEAYPHVKTAIAKFVSRAMRIRCRIVGKQPDPASERFSEVLSFVTRLADGSNVKFLIEKGWTDEQYATFIEELHE